MAGKWFILTFRESSSFAGFLHALASLRSLPSSGLFLMTPFTSRKVRMNRKIVQLSEVIVPFLSSCLNYSNLSTSYWSYIGTAEGFLSCLR